jgi:hypothetical protein
MSDKKISQLPASTTPLGGTEELAIVQSGDTKKVTVADLTENRSVGARDLTLSAPTSQKIFDIKYGTLLSVGGIYVDSGSLYIGGGANPYTNGLGAHHQANFITLRANGSDKFEIGAAGNLVVKTAGAGIDFSADPSAAGMTSKLLDDYEEGTWTPTDASGAGLTLSITSATYTKIGNIVTLSAVISYPSTADISAAKIGGLPFNGLTNSPVLIAQYSNVAVVGYINTNAINIVRADNYTTAITNVSLSTNGVLISATYTV